MVLIGVFFTTLLTFGLLQSLGVFFVDWQEDFGASAQAVGWSSSVFIAGFGLAGEKLRACSPLKNVGSIPTSRPGIDLTLNRVPTSTIILGRTHFSSNVGSSLHTRMSVF